MILLDTNIVIHGNQPGSPHYNTITQRLIEFAENAEDLIICPQVLYELYVVATRPIAQNGLGISSDEASAKIENLIDTYTFINDPDNLFSTWHICITVKS
jgi:predicted nucleic acid-binding protein